MWQQQHDVSIKGRCVLLMPALPAGYSAELDQRIQGFGGRGEQYRGSAEGRNQEARGK